MNIHPIRRRSALRHPAPGRLAWWLLALAVLSQTACATVAEHRKLEQRVNELKARGGGSTGQSLADLRTEVAQLRDGLARLEGRLEVAEHSAKRALDEAQQARREANSGVAGPAALGATALGATGMAGPPDGATPGAEGPYGSEGAYDAGGPPPASAELAAYRSAYDAWRTGQTEACIDRFGRFLQTHQSSSYADDASFWLADCYFKQGDYRNAVLRFDDVVQTFPNSEKAAEALYRQGESLLKLNRSKAAETAFKRLLDAYPGSGMAGEARRQLQLMGAG